MRDLWAIGLVAGLCATTWSRAVFAAEGATSESGVEPDERPSGEPIQPTVPKTQRRGRAESLALGPRRSWYGWQTLLVSVPSIGIAALGREQSSPIAPAGLIGFVLGGPVVHAAHGHWGRAALSLGLNSVTPILFFAALPRDCTPDADAPADSSVCRMDWKAVVSPGLLLGALIALGVDASFIAHEDKPPQAALRFVPHVALLGRGALAGVQGGF